MTTAIAPPDADFIEIEAEVPAGGLINYDMRRLCSALGVTDPACLTVETDGLTKALITVYKKPPLANIPQARGEDLVMDADGYITVGRYHDGLPARMRLYEPGSGAQRSAVFGTTGAGKSRALQLILAAEKRSGIVSWLSDLKGGQSLPEAKGQVDWHITTQEDTLAMLEAAVRVAEHRMRALARLGRSSFAINSPFPLLSVRIDEANRLLEKGAEFRDDAALLVKELGRTGRSVGVGVGLAAQAGHVDELGGSDTLRGMLKEGETILLRWSSSMMQSLVSDGLLPPGAQLATIPKRSGPPQLQSRFTQTTDRGASTAGQAYLLGSPRPTAMMRFFPVGSPIPVEGLDPQILDLYGPGAPAILEEDSWDTAGYEYIDRNNATTRPQQTSPGAEPAARPSITLTNSPAPRSGGKPTTSARILHALEQGPLHKDDIVNEVNADGGNTVSAGGIGNALSVMKKAGQVQSAGAGVYQLPQHQEQQATTAEQELSDLVSPAVELVIATQFASPTMLQRKLRIGWAQANQLMDFLEQMNIVGPDQGGNNRNVLVRAEDLESALDNINRS